MLLLLGEPNCHDRERHKVVRAEDKNPSCYFDLLLCGSHAVMLSKAHLPCTYVLERRCMSSLTPKQAPPNMAPWWPEAKHQPISKSQCNKVWQG